MSIKIGLIGEDISASLSPFLHEREGRENSTVSILVARWGHSIER